MDLIMDSTKLVLSTFQMLPKAEQCLIVSLLIIFPIVLIWAIKTLPRAEQFITIALFVAFFAPLKWLLLFIIIYVFLKYRQDQLVKEYYQWMRPFGGTAPLDPYQRKVYFEWQEQVPNLHMACVLRFF